MLCRPVNQDGTPKERRAFETAEEKLRSVATSVCRGKWEYIYIFKKNMLNIAASLDQQIWRSRCRIWLEAGRSSKRGAMR